PARVADLARASGQPVPRDPGEVTRAILDSLAEAYRRAVLGLAEAAGREVEVIHVVGGGSRNTLLCRLTAEATALPVVVGPAEGAALGNLLLQAATLGDLPANLPTLRQVAATSTHPPLTTHHP
ncbi:MAG: rhamnulokinase, partial [Actinomycetales bacterium]|nr:rhamnulokinase [Actinomycetales bacterium]